MQFVAAERAEILESGGHYVLKEWEDEWGVVVGTSGAGLDLAIPSQPENGTLPDSWLSFFTDRRERFTGVVVSQQVHGRKIITHPRTNDGIVVAESADGHVTAARGLLLAITVADCVPVFILDPERVAVGVVHVGWRGLAAGIMESAIAAMNALGAKPASLVIHCGVSICGSCYEVGPEVISEVTGRSSSAPGPLDIRAEVVARARKSGVRRASISPWCTAHDLGRFHSHRRSGGSKSRMAAYIGLPLG